VVDLTPVQEYDEGFDGGVGYDQMEEEDPFYQPEEEAKDEDDEVEGDGGLVPEPEPGQLDDRADKVHDMPIVGPSFSRGPHDTTLLSKYAKHVAVTLWVNDKNVSVLILSTFYLILLISNFKC